jgi:hypothetical protein
MNIQPNKNIVKIKFDDTDLVLIKYVNLSTVCRYAGLDYCRIFNTLMSHHWFASDEMIDVYYDETKSVMALSDGYKMYVINSDYEFIQIVETKGFWNKK